jgi:hypothetical protein
MEAALFVLSFFYLLVFERHFKGKTLSCWNGGPKLTGLPKDSMEK